MQLTHTSFILSDIPPQLLAAPHVLDPTLRVNPFYPYSRQHAPSSHLFSNVDDMNRYAQVQLDQGRSPALRVVPASAYQQMWTSEIATNMDSPWEKTLGLGWFLGDYHGHRLVGHGGGDTGFACGVIMAPNDGIAVVVMQNREVNAEELAFTIMALLLSLDDHHAVLPIAR
jgi:CubicO group peptidase (beta-lactamase class C family)